MTFPADAGDRAELTEDAFLGGALKLWQPRRGYRAGVDAVMLAAAVPAAPGEAVLEAGIGAGAASLCLLRRAGALELTGLEREGAMAELALRNAARNGFAGSLRIVAGDVTMPGRSWQAHGLKQAFFDHSFANPPFYERGRARPARDPLRMAANMREPGELEDWIRFLTAMTRSGGSITLILPPADLGEALAAFGGRAGNIALFPLFPRRNTAAIRLIVQARKGSRAPLRMLSGLVLHDAGGAQSDAAEALLRRGEALDLSG